MGCYDHPFKTEPHKSDRKDLINCSLWNAVSIPQLISTFISLMVSLPKYN